MHTQFEVHKLNPTGFRRAELIARIFDEALDAIEQLVPQGREMSIVSTKLEEACFFAKKGLAVSPYNQLKD